MASRTGAAAFGLFGDEATVSGVKLAFDHDDAVRPIHVTSSEFGNRGTGAAVDVFVEAAAGSVLGRVKGDVGVPGASSRTRTRGAMEFLISDGLSWVSHWSMVRSIIPALILETRMCLARWVNRQLRQMKTAGLGAGRLRRFERLTALVAEETASRTLQEQDFTRRTDRSLDSGQALHPGERQRDASVLEKPGRRPSVTSRCRAPSSRIPRILEL